MLITLGTERVKRFCQNISSYQFCSLALILLKPPAPKWSLLTKSRRWEFSVLMGYYGVRMRIQ